MKFIEIDSEDSRLFAKTNKTSRVWINLSAVIAIDWDAQYDFEDSQNRVYQMIGVIIHFAKPIWTVIETSKDSEVDAFFYNIKNARRFAEDFKSWLFNEERIFKWHEKAWGYEDGEDYEDYEEAKKVMKKHWIEG